MLLRPVIIIAIVAVAIIGMVVMPSAYSEVPPPLEKIILTGCTGSFYDSALIFELDSQNSIFIPSTDDILCKITSTGELSTLNFADALNGGYIHAFHIDADDNLFFSGNTADDVYKVTQSGFQLLNFDVVNNLGDSINVRDITTDNVGNIYVLGADIFKFNQAGIYLETLDLPPSEYGSMKILTSDSLGNIYYDLLTPEFEFQINKILPNGNVITVVEDQNLSCLADIEIDSTGNIYVANSSSCTDNSSAKYDPSGELLFKFETNPKPEHQNLKQIEMSVNGKIYALQNLSWDIFLFRDKFVEDNIPPVITPIDDIIIEATSSAGSSVAFSTNAVDAIDGVMDVTCSPESGTTFPVGTSIPVTCTSTDYSFNSDFVTFDVKVVDSTSPTISLIQDMISTSYLDSTKIEFNIPTATDNLGISGSVTCDPAPNTLFPIGTTTVTCSVSDISGNTGTSQFTVEIQRVDPPIDNTHPIINIPNNVSIQTNTDSPKSVTFSVTATDDMDGSLIPTCSHNSGSSFPVGATTVTCSVSDNAGNSDSKSFTINLNYVIEVTQNYLPDRDDIGYEWKFPTNKQVYNELEDSRGIYADEYEGFAEESWRGYMKGGGFDTNFLDLYIYRFINDNDDYSYYFWEDHMNYWKLRGGFSSWAPSWNSISADECFGRVVMGMATDKIALYCYNEDIVVFATTTGYPWEMKDELSNFIDSVFDKIPNNQQTNTQSTTPDPVVTPVTPDPVTPEPISDTIDPELLLPTNITVSTDKEYGTIVTYNVKAIDNIDGSLTPICKPVSGTKFNVGTTEVWCGAEDSSGNYNIDSFFVTINLSKPLSEEYETVPSDVFDDEYKIKLESNDSTFQTGEVLRVYATFSHQESSAGQYLIKDDQGNTIVSKTFIPRSDKLYKIQEVIDASWKSGKYILEVNWKFKQEIVSFYVQQNVVEQSKEIKESNVILEPVKEKAITEPKITETKIKPSFVDESKDPQYYIDRYDNEPKYKEWFDNNFPEYTINEAVGLPEPVKEKVPVWVKHNVESWSQGEIDEEAFVSGISFLINNKIIDVPKVQTEIKEKPSFVDESKDPQYYIDRYDNEPKYKVWFDSSYSDYTIHEAVGLKKPIPAWVKNNADWWVQGIITEDEFLKGMEYLVKESIIDVN